MTGLSHTGLLGPQGCIGTVTVEVPGLELKA